MRILKKLEIFWITCTVLILSIAVYLVKDMLIIRAEMEKYPQMEKRPFSHIYYMILAAIVVTIIKTILSRSSQDYLYKRVEQNFEESLWKEKKSKVVHIFVSTIFYSCTCLYGLYSVWGDENMPRQIFGGSESPLTFMKQWPNAPSISSMETYFIIQMGSKLYSITNHFINHRHHYEFAEMSLHHFLTVFSMIYSYYINLHNAAVVVLILHEFGDWAMNFNKFMRDILGLSSIKIFPFFGLILYFFVYFRVFVQFQIVLIPIYNEFTHFKTKGIHMAVEGAENLEKILYSPVNFLVVMVLLLYFLNLVWSFLTLRVLFNFFTKKSFHNDAHGEKTNKLRKDK